MTAAIALVGDHRDTVIAHQAIPRALALAGAAAGVAVTWEWVRTDEINPDSGPPAPARPRRSLADFAAIWVVPGSPYACMAGALAAIRFARESGRPFLGTCGGFQHALIEFARDVCGVPDADHAETADAATAISAGRPALVVIPLQCSLVGQTGCITFVSGSRLHAIFGGKPALEGYHCSYGLNPAWRGRLEAAGLRFTGFDANADVRAVELPDHPFFVGTLFQPERSALRNQPHPLITAFVRAAAAGRAG